MEPILGHDGSDWISDWRRSLLSLTEGGAEGTTARLVKEHGRSAREGVQKPAVHPVWFDRGPPFHSNNYLRHDLGRPFPPGGTRI